VVQGDQGWQLISRGRSRHGLSRRALNNLSRRILLGGVYKRRDRRQSTSRPQGRIRRRMKRVKRNDGMQTREMSRFRRIRVSRWMRCASGWCE
jgi:hypothetical protein